MDKKALFTCLREKMDKEQSLSALWTTKMINDFPDSSFAVVEKGGKKDDSGKTEPRSYRHLPYKNASGAIDLPHLRNALARMNQIQAASTKDSTERIRAVARRVLIAAAKKSLPSSQFAKGEIFGAKASIANVEQVGECKYMDIMFEADVAGPDGKTMKMPISMPMDLYYDKEGKLTDVKLYWQSVPALILNDFADFLKTLESEPMPKTKDMPMKKDMPNAGY